MRRLRTLAIALLLVFGVLFNLDSLDLGTMPSFIDIPAPIYALIGAAVLITVAFPSVGRVSLPIWLGAWVSFYILVKGGSILARPVFGGIYSYITITELALLVLSVMLAHSYSKELVGLEESIAAVIIPAAGKRAKPLEEAEAEVEREFARSRRNNLLLSLLIVEPDTTSIMANVQKAIQEAIEDLKKRYLLNHLLKSISQEMRRTDMVLEQPEKNRFILLLPDTDANNARTLMKRIQEAVMKNTDISISMGSASFPNQALTLDEMIRVAEEEIASPAAAFGSNGHKNRAAEALPATGSKRTPETPDQAVYRRDGDNQ